MIAEAVTAFSLLISPASTLVHGGQVSFISTYPQDARQKVGKQQAHNPVVQVDCIQNGANTFRGIADFETESRNGDGIWTGETYPLRLDSPDWADTFTYCGAVLYYANRDPRTHALIIYVIATISFVVP